MATTDTSEKGLEALIVHSLVEEARYVPGDSKDYDREHAVDTGKLFAFLAATQPDTLKVLNIGADSPPRTKFLHRLQGEIARHGIIEVLRKGLKHGQASVVLFYGSPSPGNTAAEERFRANIFSITRQLRYSKDETQLSLDLCLFINGLPIATFELKNGLTKQTVADAIQQYKRDRDPRELLFQFGRCVVHFAVDDQEVRMCTWLQGKDSWFLPFNKGWKHGAGNPPNPDGLKTDYLWKEVLTRKGLTDILENYAQVVEEPDTKGRKKHRQVFPRYHQLDVVHKLLENVRTRGVGKRYLIQHSAGSGKSNSIAWLAHQLIGVEKAGKTVFDSVVVVTDRRVLDKQIRDIIKQFAQVSATVGHAESADDLRLFLENGKKLIITTVQKFPYILNAIGDEHRGRKFAIIIDEAHSSQGGRTSATLNFALAEQSAEDEEETVEDCINRIMETRKMLTNASYFAFTATPKNKTLELFGERQRDGTFRAIHTYTMKQAIEEQFILDVLRCYTPVSSYYRLVKTVEDDPEFETKKARKKMKRYVEGHEHAIRQKAEIMIDHFHDQVIARKKIGGNARAMVVTGSIQRAMQYKKAFDAYLTERKSPYKAIVAFSGEHEFDGEVHVNEATMNGFPSGLIPDKFREDPYRFLIVAEKYQTGFDEPLLHTMYVDKVLSDVKAVQTLSRLNRAHPQKHDVFVLDFVNNTDTIEAAFADYYQTTVLSKETDPNKLHDLKTDLDGSQVYGQADVEQLVELYLGGARTRLDPILDRCAATYKTTLNEDEQIAFKSKAKMFVRTYNFLATVLPYSLPEWEYLATFLTFLTPKLPAPKEDDLSQELLEAIDMDSYRAEVKAQLEIALPDKDGEVDPVPLGSGGLPPTTETDRLSNIVRSFNDQFGSIEWKDVDKIRQIISEEIPGKVAADKAYQNAKKQPDKQNARIEHDNALRRVMNDILADQTELYKQFSDNDSFRKWLADMVFTLTFENADD